MPLISHFSQFKLAWFSISIFIVLWSIWATVLYPNIEQISSPSLRQVVSDSVRLLIWSFPIAFFSFVRKEKLPHLYLSSIPKYKLQIGILWFVYFCLVWLAEFFLLQDGRQFDLDFSYFSGWHVVLAIFGAPFIEEVLFRGFFFYKLLSEQVFWKANLVQAVLFSGIHFPFRIYNYGFNLDDITLFFSLLLLGLLFGYSVEKTDSLWFAIIPHVLNNLFANLFRIT